MPDPVRRMEIQGRLEVTVMELFQEVFRVREEGLAPSIACTARRRSDGARG